MPIVRSNKAMLRTLGWIALGFTPVWIASVAYVMLHQGQNHSNEWLYGLCAGFCTYPMALFIVPVVIWFSGTWTIDEQGIAWSPMWRRERRIRWDQVERVKWTSATAEVRGEERASIPFPFNTFEKFDAAALREALEKGLSPHFDLSLPGPRPRPTPREVTISAVRIAIVTGIVAAVLLALAYWAYDLARRYSRIVDSDMPALVLLAFTLAIIPVVVFVLVRETRKPSSPGRWRSRVSSALG